MTHDELRVILAKCLLACDLLIHTSGLGICQHIKSRIQRTNPAVCKKKKVLLVAWWQETRSWQVLWQRMECHLKYIFFSFTIYLRFWQRLMRQNRLNLRSYQKLVSFMIQWNLVKERFLFLAERKSKTVIGWHFSRETLFFWVPLKSWKPFFLPLLKKSAVKRCVWSVEDLMLLTSCLEKLQMPPATSVAAANSLKATFCV